MWVRMSIFNTSSLKEDWRIMALKHLEGEKEDGNRLMGTYLI
jgi:hypothetical protein